MWAADAPPSLDPPRRKRGRRLLLVTLVVLGVLFVVGAVVIERVGRDVASDEIADRLTAQGLGGMVDVDLGGSWWDPVVLRALVFDHLDEAHITLSRAQVAGLPIEQARYTLSDVEVAVSERSRTAEVTSVGSTTARLTVDPEALGELIGVPLRVVGDDLELRRTGERVELRVDGGDLVVDSRSLRTDGPLPSLPVVDGELLACLPQVRVEGGSLVLECTGDQVPGILRWPLGLEGSADLSDLPPAPDVSDLPESRTTARPGG